MFKAWSTAQQAIVAHDGGSGKAKAIDKAELSFFQDTRKDELFALKEELFFTIDEKSQEVDLSEKSRSFMNPDASERLRAPGLDQKPSLLRSISMIR